MSEKFVGKIRRKNSSEKLVGKITHRHAIGELKKQGILYLKFSINYFTAYPNTDNVTPIVKTHQQSTSTGVNTNDKGKLLSKLI